MTYTLEDTKRLLEAQIAKMGEDYVYPKAKYGDSCVYFGRLHHEPACIVGHVLADVGISADQVDTYENTMNAKAITAVTNNFDVNSVCLLYWTQDYQDNGAPWGEAYRSALKAYNGDD